tara:strand:+ start:151 stop:477 length:327 start_codon:yes stop_codon:yes gene_type:complete
MEVTQKIIEYCGLKPSSVEFVDVGNNPNFVFTNDTNFETVILYDVEGNIINVNSWLECAHYVNGGWVNNMDAFINEEKILFFVLIGLIVAGSFFKKYLIKIKDHYLNA